MTVNVIDTNEALWKRYIPQRLSQTSPKMRALDIGFGFGQDSIYLASSGFNVVALEVSKSCITKLPKASHNLEIDVINKSLESYQDTDGFDVILLNYVDHFYADDVFKMQLRKIRNFAKDNCLIILSMINPSSDRLCIVNSVFKRCDQTGFFCDCVKLSSGKTVPIVCSINKLTISSYRRGFLHSEEDSRYG